jgi:hypothetical protein
LKKITILKPAYIFQLLHHQSSWYWKRFGICYSQA